MKNLTPLILALSLGIGLSPQPTLAQTDDSRSVRNGEAALTYAAGGLQKFTPRDGIVNLITGDNQTTGNRMLLGRLDTYYLKLDKPGEAGLGDLFTVYRRVRKVFHPVTKEYLGFAVIRLAVVKVTQVDDMLTTVEAVRSYGTVAPGDLVMRFAAPTPEVAINPATEVSDVSGMIVEFMADRAATLIGQSDVVYLDRGREDGLKAGDLMDIYRRSAGLPTRKVGQLKVLSTEDRTATAKILKARSRIMVGDRLKVAGYSAPAVQPVELTPVPEPSQAVPAAVPADLVAGQLKVQDASGQSRINLGELPNLLRYDSGEAALKPESYKVLDQLIEYLHTSGDARLIRVEGHADNVEIGPSLKSRYPTNWELSKARASGVVRYLVERGGLDSARLSSVGYGDSRPVATNAIEEGRTKNRRVEILLYAPQADAQATQPDLPSQVQHKEDDSSSLSARGNNDQPVVPADNATAAEPGTLSVGDSSPAPAPDGTTAPTSSEESNAAAPDAAKQDSSQSAVTPLP